MQTLSAIWRFIFPQGQPLGDDLQEGAWADQYTDPVLRQQIAQRYQQRWQPQPTPVTNPELFDPLEPPPGWRYDPYYEVWMEITP